MPKETPWPNQATRVAHAVTAHSGKQQHTDGPKTKHHAGSVPGYSDPSTTKHEQEPGTRWTSITRNP